jgi:tetratricopeptide (TPR) repeat protein
MKKATLIVISMLLSLTAFSLSEEEYFRMRDSLQLRVDHSLGTERLDATTYLVRHIVMYEPETADSLIQEQFKIAEKLNYTNGKAGAYHNLGSLLFYKGDYTAAMNNWLEALNLFESLNNWHEAAQTYMRMVMVYHFTGNTDKIPVYYHRILDYFGKTNDRFFIASIYNWVGYHYNNFEVNPELAKYYLHKSIALAAEINMPSILWAGIYASLSLAYRIEGQYDSALVAMHKSFTYLEEDTDDNRLYRILGYKDLGFIYLMRQQMDSAIYYFERSIAESEEISYLFNISVSSLVLAKIYLRSDDIDKAEDLLIRAYNAGLEINRSGSFYAGSKNKYAAEWIGDGVMGIFKFFSPPAKKYWAKRRALQPVCLELSKLYKARGELAKALEYHEEYHAWSDSVKLIERASELFNLQMNYETEIKDKRIEMLSQSNELKELRVRQYTLFLLGMGAFIILSIAVLLLLLRQRHLKAEQDKTGLQQKVFQLQMNPHFIFNSLASIQHLIVEQDTEKASICLAEFSNLVRSILYSSANETISLDMEIRTIESYLALQKMRYNYKFDYDIILDPGLDPENLEIPVMLLQPFVENAIEHGIRNKPSPGLITVDFRLNASKLFIAITDNGIGRAKAQELMQQRDKTHKSMATAITMERIKVLNRKLKRKINLEIIDLKDEQGDARGTKVVFGVPV